MMISTDGVTWQTLVSGAPGAEVLYTAASNGSRSLLGGTKGLVFRSDNSTGWFLSQNQLTDRDLELGASQNGITLVSRFWTTDYLYTEDDQTWQLRPFPISAFNKARDITAGQGMFVAGLSEGQIAISTNGLDWIRENVVGANRVDQVALNQNTMMALYVDNIYTRPTSGGDWTFQADLPLPVNELAAGPDLFVAVGDYGAIQVSTDGSQWETVTSPSGNHLNGVAYSDQTRAWVIVGTESNVLYSPDGRNWTRNHIGSALLESVTWAGDHWLAVGNGEMLISVDGQSWTPAPGVSATTGLRVVTWNGANAVAAGDHGALIASTCNIDCTPLAITQEPLNQTVMSGSTAQFSVTVDGDAPYSYQWLHDDAAIANATTATLTITDADLADQGSYQCRINNDCSLVFSESAQLEIGGPPIFTSQPEDGITCLGEVARFHTLATGTIHQTYQWSHDNTPILGAIYTTLTLNQVTSQDAGTYTCTVTNPFGTATSNPAQLTIDTGLALIQQPQDQNECIGGTVTLTLEAESVNALTFEWTKDGLPIPNAFSNTLVLNSLTLDDAGIYQCMVNSPCQTVISEKTVITVTSTPLILSHPPAQQPLCYGADLSLAVLPGGQGPFSYQWTKDQEPISGATGPQHLIQNALPTDAGVYTCTITGPCGSISSQPSELVFGLTQAAMTFNAMPQGLDPITLGFNYACDPAEIAITWIRESDPTILAQDVDHLTLDPPPLETTTYLVQLEHLPTGQSVTLDTTVLVSANPLIQDPNGDGCNTMADLYLAGLEWRRASDLFDADNNQFLDIRDLLYINITQTTCDPEVQATPERGGR